MTPFFCGPAIPFVVEDAERRSRGASSIPLVPPSTASRPTSSKKTRSGVLLGGGHGHGPREGLSRREAAADDLVRVLYRGILRRERAGDVEPSFVDLTLDRSLDGLGQVAETMTLSEEFRYRALERTEQEHGRGYSLDELRELLLQDIYRSLYGYVEPSRRERQEDLRALDICLSDKRRSREACGDLGHNLVRNHLFYERHRDKVDALRRGPRDFYRR